MASSSALLSSQASSMGKSAEEKVEGTGDVESTAMVFGISDEMLSRTAQIGSESHTLS
jgi:hypothetical protein